jgi:hypothetical protein
MRPARKEQIGYEPPFWVSSAHNLFQLIQPVVSVSCSGNISGRFVKPEELEFASISAAAFPRFCAFQPHRSSEAIIQVNLLI